jgi:protein-S-isoprenylcysteine O-methyltransferase Ste14
VLYFFFYYPTAVVGSVPNDRTKIKEMKDLDYVGMFLFVAGFLLFAMGLSHPWDSVNVLATMIIGFALCVVFVLYGMPLRNQLGITSNLL